MTSGIPTVPVVQSSQPEQLGDAAGRTGASLQQLQQHLEQAKNSVAQLRGGWEGTASDAANASAEQVFARQERVISALQRMQTTLSQGGSQLSATRSTVVAGVNKLEQVGYQVASDGTVSVSPGSRLEQLAKMSTTAAMQIQSVAATSSAQLKSTLADFGQQDAALNQALQALSDELDAEQGGGRSAGGSAQALGGDPFADDNDDVFDVPVDPGGAASGGSVIGPIPDELI